MVFQTQWAKIETDHLTSLKDGINACIPILEKHLHFANALYRCKYIVANMDKPWSHPTLTRIINQDNGSENEQLNEGTYHVK